MSKGNMLLGYARGSVGDMVFQRTKGQQITKARNRNPFNPKTGKQMSQRSDFTNTVKFFTRGVQNFFKFAFESKKEQESDFNAFMRYNKNNGLLISPNANVSETYPALGKYTITQGTLKSPTLRCITDEEQGEDSYNFFLPQVQQNSSWGEISQILKTNYNLEDGDIVTILYIHAAGSTKANTPEINPEARGSVSWVINQAEINPKNNNTIQQVFNNYDIELSFNNISIVKQNASDCCACAIIFSRNTRNKLKVSTTVLTPNKTSEKVMFAASSDAYKNNVLAAWGANSISILQGGSLNAVNIGGVNFYGFIGATPDTNFDTTEATEVGVSVAIKPTTRTFYIKILCDNLSKLDTDSWLTVDAEEKNDHFYIENYPPDDGYIQVVWNEGYEPVATKWYYMDTLIFTVPAPEFTD